VVLLARRFAECCREVLASVRMLLMCVRISAAEVSDARCDYMMAREAARSHFFFLI
jgi:hypothetical protein